VKMTGRNPEPVLRVLSAVFLDPASWKQAAALSADDDIPHDALKEVFRAMQKLAAAGDEISRVNVAELNREAYLTFDALEKELIPRAVASDIDEYIRRVRAESAMREAVRELGRLTKHAANGGLTPDDLLRIGELGTRLQNTKEGIPARVGCSTAELFAAQEKVIKWMCWPFAAIGLASILDALPKVGKTVLFLLGILASRLGQHFLSLPTKPMRVVYVSEQSRASLAMQAREIGFTGREPPEELFWITREDWSRYVYTDFLAKLENEIIKPGTYNVLIIDTFHTVSRMEDEKDASEVNRLGNLTIDVATRNGLALALGRHDRKSGGEVGISGRSSIQLSGLADVILHLVRVPNHESQRKLEILGRVPGLPNEQLIDLVNGAYVNWGQPQPETTGKSAQVAEWLKNEPGLTGEQIVARFAAMVPPIKISVATARRYASQAREGAIT